MLSTVCPEMSNYFTRLLIVLWLFHLTSYAFFFPMQTSLHRKKNVFTYEWHEIWLDLSNRKAFPFIGCRWLNFYCGTLKIHVTQSHYLKTTSFPPQQHLMQYRQDWEAEFLLLGVTFLLCGCCLHSPSIARSGALDIRCPLPFWHLGFDLNRWQLKK